MSSAVSDMVTVNNSDVFAFYLVALSPVLHDSFTHSSLTFVSSIICRKTYTMAVHTIVALIPRRSLV